MSDEAKGAILKKKINEAENIERITWIILFFGIGLIFYGWFLGNFELLVVGALFLVLSFVAGLYFTSEKNKFMEQLRNIGFKTEKDKYQSK